MTEDMNPYTLLKKQTLTLEEQEYLINHKDEWVVSKMAERSDLDHRLYEQLVTHDYVWVVIAMAKKPDLSYELLMKLANHEDWMVAKAVASRPDLYGPLLVKLLNHRCVWVRMAAKEFLKNKWLNEIKI